MNLSEYDLFLVAFSGGKDSLGIILHLLDMGVDPHKIELHHHDVDGMSPEPFMDWACTRAYCRAIASHFGIPLYLSWKEGGFKRELFKENQISADVLFETPTGEIKRISSQSSPNTRRMFPQQAASLRTRWCSSLLKIDVGDKVIRHQDRFLGKKILFLTGERAEESSNRAKYAAFEEHTTYSERKQRYIYHYRPMLHWTTQQVWDKIRDYSLIAHPAYWLGFGRCSCQFCIFLNNADLAALRAISPERLHAIAEIETEFGTTIARPNKKGISLNVWDRAMLTEPRKYAQGWDKIANQDDWQLPITIPPADWIYPPGAFSDLKGGSP